MMPSIFVLRVACALDLQPSHFDAIYNGTAPPATLTFDDVDVISFGALPWYQQLWHLPLLVPTMGSSCGNRDGLVWNINPLHPLCQPLIERSLNRSVPAHSWVEVTHRNVNNECAPFCNVTSRNAATWFCLARGSNVFANTGNTHVYVDHAQAARDLLNISCTTLGTCYAYFAELFHAAALRGYDSVQFTHHCDYAFGCKPQVCMTELVIVNASGEHSTCPVPFKTGWNYSEDCVCDSSQKFANCKGNTIPQCHAFALFYVIVCMSAILAVVCIFVCIKRIQTKHIHRLAYSTLKSSQQCEANAHLN